LIAGSFKGRSNMETWKIDSLDRLFNPKSVAVVGASDKSEKLGALALVALDSFKGDVYPVNPRLSELNGRRCYATLSDIPHDVDLAMICLRGGLVHQALSDCANAGVRAAIVLAAGFKELGSQGAAEQMRIKKLVDNAHIAVIGPNCLGAGNVNLELNATFFPHPILPRKGKVALISQSGGVSGLMIYRAVESELGISKFASVGNRVNIDFADLLKYLRNDNETKVICLFVEGTERAREMANEMKLVTEKKPVIVFKVGKTPTARAAAMSHTGSMAGESKLYSGAIKQAGGIEVDSAEDLIDTAKLMSMWDHPPKGRRVAVITHSLGIALIAAQTLEQNGVLLPYPSDAIAKPIENLLDMPVHIPIRNPIDLLAKGWAEPSVFAKAFEIVANSGEYDAILTVFSPNYQQGIGGGMPASEIVDSAHESKVPVVSVLNSPAGLPPKGKEVLEEGGIPFFASPQRAGRALANALRIA
jgi:acetyltransferase